MGLYGVLTVISLALVLVLAAVASGYTARLRDRESTQVSEDLDSAKIVIGKIRKGEPMSAEEQAYALRVVTDRGSPMAFAIPGMIFMLGCFFVFGSLEHLHGARPSERTFLGLIPMFTSTNLALRLLSNTRLKRRLRRVTPGGVVA